MREILFRGYTGRNWQYGYLIDKEAIRNFDQDGQPISTYRVIKETIGQYTGLTDKNGTKIFEGDIVEVYCVRLVGGQQRSIHDIPTKCRAVVNFENFWYGIGFNLDYENKFNEKICEPIGKEEDKRGLARRTISEFYYNKFREETNPKWLWRNHIEVIGNIHDNPELLEGLW